MKGFAKKIVGTGHTRPAHVRPLHSCLLYTSFPLGQVGGRGLQVQLAGHYVGQAGGFQ